MPVDTYALVRGVSHGLRHAVSAIVPLLCVDLAGAGYAHKWDTLFQLFDRLELYRTHALSVPAAASVPFTGHTMYSDAMLEKTSSLPELVFDCLTFTDVRSYKLELPMYPVHACLLHYVMNPVRMPPLECNEAMRSGDDEVYKFTVRESVAMFDSAHKLLRDVPGTQGVLVDFAAYFSMVDLRRDLLVLGRLALNWKATPGASEYMSAYAAFSLEASGLLTHDNRARRLLQSGLLQPFRCMPLVELPEAIGDIEAAANRTDLFPYARVALRVFFAWPRFARELELQHPQFLRWLGTPMHHQGFPCVGVRAVHRCRRGRGGVCRHISFDGSTVQRSSTTMCPHSLPPGTQRLEVFWSEQHGHSERSVRTSPQ